MLKSSSKIRVGVLGAANIAMRSLIPEIQNLSDKFEFVGLASRHPKNMEETSYAYTLYEGYESILEQNILDAVYIPLPNSLHYTWVKKALKKGLHVLVEKSLACEYEEVKELNEIAKESNLALVENFQFRFHSQLSEIKKIINNGVIGDIRIIRSTFCFPPFTDSDNIRYKKELGGGALLDAGAYTIKLSQILMGPELYITSAKSNSNSNFDVDIWGGGTLQQKNGKLFSQFSFGFDNFYQCNLEVVGSKGKMYTNRIFTAKESFKPKIILETNKDGMREIELESDNHFRNMLIYFYELVTGIKDKNIEYSQNINQARLLEEFKSKSNE
ncbi:Gfo/Idh/MocA family protein [Christiangramia forsetii]|uniref:Oxidoreductase n=2 Tax=Christiangramia forsetii TaxID=411153 RepID=A0M304_CHRFK|nr:Gfo/Idh/MocA family oxidoreductase [Christiangramia forsetii]GGG27078.1 NDP-hexose-3-ketoreductase [Christiangramia forsetii]CAL66999.1 oxidoreductase [Christiangramia forsetii KT0803]